MDMVGDPGNTKWVGKLKNIDPYYESLETNMKIHTAEK